MRIGIIGYGRFGQLWAQALADHGHDVLVYDCRPVVVMHRNIRVVSRVSVVDVPILFLLVPISALERCCREIAPLLPPQTIVLDACSVKMYPVEVMQRELRGVQPIVATHPLFGPDSVEQTGLSGHTITVCPIRVREHEHKMVRDLFQSLELMITETTPVDHDRVMARTQSLVHFIGRGLEGLGLQDEAFATPDYRSLLRMESMVKRDTWQLFFDLERYNPFALSVRRAFMKQLETVEYEIQMSGTKNLDSFDALRQHVDTIDAHLLQILGQRFEIIKKIGAVKKTNNLEAEDLDRESMIRKQYGELAAELHIDHRFVEAFCDMILVESKRIQNA